VNEGKGELTSARFAISVDVPKRFGNNLQSIPCMPAYEESTVTPASAEHRAAGIGTWQLVFFVIAAASPLGYSLGTIPFMIGHGGVSGAAGSFILASVALGIFAVGYVAMAARLRRVGGLNAFVTEGLGTVMGAGASYVGLLVYASATIGSIGMFAVFADSTARDILGFSLPWYVWSFALTAIVAVLGTRNIELNAHVLGVSIVVELLILLALSFTILAGHKPEPFSLEPLSLLGGADSYFGIHMTFAICAFAGFEATVLYSREAHDSSRAIRNATFISLALMGVIYALITVAIISATGVTRVRSLANSDPNSMFFIAANTYLGSWSVKVMEVLVVNSWFAAVLAFHNVTARYIASMGREALLPRFTASIHPTFRSPWNASIAFTVVSVVAIVAFALCHADPYFHVYMLGCTPVLVGLPVMEVLASVATIVYFTRSPGGISVWVRWIAPLTAALMIATVGIAIVAQMSIFTGQDGIVNVLLPITIPVAMLIGMARGKLLGRSESGVQVSEWSQMGTPEKEGACER
jgi:amino acid transporter